MSNQPSVVVAIHSLFTTQSEPVSGTGEGLFSLFQKKRIPYTLFSFPIFGGHPVWIQYVEGTSRKTRKLSKTSRSMMLRLPIEAFVMIRYLMLTHGVTLYIGIDPLNAFWGILGKKFLRKVERVIYYTADYADKRFNNSVLNWVYHTIDRFCVAHADQVWNVSGPIYAKREAQGLPKKKNFLIPNTPIYRSIKSISKNRYQLIIVGTSMSSLYFFPLFESMPILIKKYPKLTLHIIGALDEAGQLARFIQTHALGKHITFHGALRHDRVLQMLSRAGVGLALYKDVNSWTKYGDSMKIREYLAHGLPVITTRVVSTYLDIEAFDCGVVVDMPTSKEIIDALGIIYSRKSYKNMSKRALVAARERSYDGMVKQPLSQVGIRV